MRTIAQYSIRDVVGLDNQITEVAEPQGRANTGTFRTSGPGSIRGGSMRASSALGMTAAAMQNLQLQTGGAQELAGNPQQPGSTFGPPLPTGVSEMPSERYPDSIPELATGSTVGERRDGSDSTPTEAPKEFLPRLPADDSSAVHYSPLDTRGVFDDDSSRSQSTQSFPLAHHQQYGASGLSTAPALPPPAGPDERPPEPHYANKPYLNAPQDDQQQQQQQQYTYQSYQSYQPDGAPQPQPQDRWSLPSQQHYQQQQQQYQAASPPAGGGLRIANQDDAAEDADAEWRQEAIMSMNFAGAGPDSIARYS